MWRTQTNMLASVTLLKQGETGPIIYYLIMSWIQWFEIYPNPPKFIPPETALLIPVLVIKRQWITVLWQTWYQKTIKMSTKQVTYNYIIKTNGQLNKIDFIKSALGCDMNVYQTLH